MIDVADGRQETAVDLLHFARQRADALQQVGTGEDRSVVLSGTTPIAFLHNLLAIWLTGATAVVVPTSLRAGERANVVDKTGARLWLNDDEITETSPSASVHVPPDIALVLMTSGTSGDPKGVMLSHAALRTRLAINCRHIPDADLGRALSILPMHFGHGLIGNMLTPLASGGTLVCWPQPGPADLMRIGQVIDDQRIAFMSSVPAHWQAITRLAAPPERGTLQRVHVGSAPLSGALWQAIADWCGTRNVVNMYGMTETANWVGGCSAQAFPAGSPLPDNHVGQGWDASFRIARDDPSDAAGEVLVRSEALMSGYLGHPEASAAVLDEGWYRTGDTGCLDASGALTLTGRLRDEINAGGVKIPAVELDLLLERHPDVMQACAFAIPDPLAGECAGVSVVLAPASVETAETLRAWLRERIRVEAAPRHIFIVSALPGDARGKLNREKVRKAVMAETREAE